MRGRQSGSRIDRDEAPQHEATPQDGEPVEPASSPGGTYRVPGVGVVAASIEAAGHWDDRLWRRGPIPG